MHFPASMRLTLGLHYGGPSAGGRANGSMASHVFGWLAALLDKEPNGRSIPEFKTLQFLHVLPAGGKRSGFFGFAD